MFQIKLEGVSKDVIGPKLEALDYTIALNSKTIGKKDPDPNHIICETILPDMNQIGDYMNSLHRIDGIIEIAIVQIRPIAEKISTYRNLIPILISTIINLLSIVLILFDVNKILAQSGAQLDWTSYLQYIGIPSIVMFLTGVLYTHFRQRF
jgi:hypothetical protein